MLTLIVIALAFAFFSFYLERRGDRLTAPEAGLLILSVASVWGWFLAFRLDAGGLFAGGGAIVWTIVLAVICISIFRRAHKQHAAAQRVRSH